MVSWARSKSASFRELLDMDVGPVRKGCTEASRVDRQPEETPARMLVSLFRGG
jgi:hypothetical protein